MNNKANIVRLLGRILIYNFIVIVLLIIGVASVIYFDSNRAKFKVYCYKLNVKVKIYIQRLLQ